MSCPFRSVVPTKIESFITVPWRGLPIEAGGNPGYGIVGCVSRDEGVTDALQHLESDPVPVSAKRVYVGCRHRWPDQEIGSTLRNERWDLGWQGPRRVLGEQFLPGFDGRQISDRQELPIQRQRRTATDEDVEPSFDAFICKPVDNRKRRWRHDRCDRDAIDLGPRPDRHRGDVVAASGSEVLRHECCQIGCQRLTMPVVGCAHATIGRPPSGMAPAGTMITPDTGKRPVDV
jgi:hypothetical protein